MKPQLLTSDQRIALLIIAGVCEDSGILPDVLDQLSSLGLIEVDAELGERLTTPGWSVVDAMFSSASASR